MPQSARLTEGGGVQSLFGQCPFEPGDNFGGGFPYTSKVKEENLEVAGGKCWRGFWLSALNITGEIFHQFPLGIIFV